MRITILLVLLCSSVCMAQQTRDNSGPQNVPAQSNSFIIPGGTTIPAKLTGPITVRSRVGDPVRAVTTFPVTVGTQIAIPAGSYLEGEIVKLNKRRQTVKMRFTQLVYANGYSIAVDGAATQPDASASDLRPPIDGTTPGASANGFLAAPEAEFGSSQPFPQPQSHVGLFIGLSVAAAVATVLMAVLLRHHRGAGEAVLFETGSQFEVVLNTSVSIDAARIAGLADAPAAE